MFQALIIIHMIAAIAMVGCILLQQGRGATAGAGFGGGGAGSGSVFGAQGSANFLSRSTAILATLFFATSLTLSIMGGRSAQPEKDLLDDADLPVVEKDIPTAVQSDVPVASEPSQAVSDEIPDVVAPDTEHKQPSPQDIPTAPE